MQGYYAGFDIGRTFHVLVVVDGVGKRVVKRRVANTFNGVQDAINRVLSIASGSDVCWAVEMVDRNVGCSFQLWLSTAKGSIRLRHIG